jgi:chlorite dismutase
VSEKNLRDLNHFAAYQFSQAFWEADEAGRRRALRRIHKQLSGICEHVHMYQVFPSMPELDFLAWAAMPSRDEGTLADFYASYARAMAPLRRWVRPEQILWGYTGKSTYSRARSSQEIDPYTSTRPRYLVAYPFVKTPDWYMMGRDTRQGMMNEHIRLGKSYPQIKQLLLYSFGLQDQEFVVVYEMDDLPLFSDLVHELRATEARRYTDRDTPIITGVHRQADEWDHLWDPSEG